MVYKKKYPKHLVLIDNGILCKHCGISAVLTPNDLDVVTRKIEGFIRAHRRCKTATISATELMDEYEKRLRNSVSPRLSVPEREIRYIIAKFRAAEKLLAVVESDGTAVDAANAVIEYRDVKL